jgi:hypothetical protein
LTDERHAIIKVMKFLQVRMTPDMAATITRALDGDYHNTPDTSHATACATLAAHLRYRAIKLWGPSYGQPVSAQDALFDDIAELAQPVNNRPPA